MVVYMGELELEVKLYNSFPMKVDDFAYSGLNNIEANINNILIPKTFD